MNPYVMTVWIATYGYFYEGPLATAIHLTKEGAEAHLEEWKKEEGPRMVKGCWWEVNEMEVLP